MLVSQFVPFLHEFASRINFWHELMVRIMPFDVIIISITITGYLIMQTWWLLQRRMQWNKWIPYTTWHVSQWNNFSHLTKKGEFWLILPSHLCYTKNTPPLPKRKPPPPSKKKKEKENKQNKTKKRIHTHRHSKKTVMLVKCKMLSVASKVWGKWNTCAQSNLFK